MRPWLLQHRQYAYCQHRAIDAIHRAAAPCTRVRDMLQAAQVSVEAGGQGRKSLPCSGGVTISIDLSRAFDQFPRWGLVASLRHAKVPEALISLVVIVHELCTYRVKHAALSGEFPLKVGALLSCIFSCWLGDLLDARLGYRVRLVRAASHCLRGTRISFSGSYAASRTCAAGVCRFVPCSMCSRTRA